MSDTIISYLNFNNTADVLEDKAGLGWTVNGSYEQIDSFLDGGKALQLKNGACIRSNPFNLGNENFGICFDIRVNTIDNNSDVGLMRFIKDDGNVIASIYFSKENENAENRCSFIETELNSPEKTTINTDIIERYVDLNVSYDCSYIYDKDLFIRHTRDSTDSSYYTIFQFQNKLTSKTNSLVVEIGDFKSGSATISIDILGIIYKDTFRKFKSDYETLTSDEIMQIFKNYSNDDVMIEKKKFCHHLHLILGE